MKIKPVQMRGFQGPEHFQMALGRLNGTTPSQNAAY